MARLNDQGSLVFRPHVVQKGRGPHLLDWAYATDEHGDSFPSNITASTEGVVISDTEGEDRFAVEVRWNVEGFGYIFMTADNAGEFYRLPGAGKQVVLNLNVELARSRVARNLRRVEKHAATGWSPSRELRGFLDLSSEYLAEATAARGDEARKAERAQTALHYALWASEMIELEHARWAIQRRGFRSDFWTGCDARGYF